MPPLPFGAIASVLRVAFDDLPVAGQAWQLVLQRTGVAFNH